MSRDSSDEEFHVTKVIKPSPVKKSSLLKNPRGKRAKYKKLEEVVSSMEKTDNELLSYIEKNLTNDLINESSSVPKTPNAEDSDKIILFPQGRPFFIDVKDDLTPSLWFPKNSIFHCQNLKDFIHFVKMGVLGLRSTNLTNILPGKLVKILKQTKFMNNDKETIALRQYCLSLINIEGDKLFTSLLFDFLSTCHFPYELISLKEKGSQNFGRFLEILQKHVAEYKPDEARVLFRDAFLASLDPKTIICKSVFPGFLYACLQVSTDKFPVETEINWIIQQKLTPEEFSYILAVLPQNPPYKTMSLQVGMGGLKQIFNAESTPCETVTLESLVEFLKKRKSKISTLPANTVYHVLNILSFMFQRFPSYDEEPLEEFNSIVSGFKRHFKMGMNVSYFSLNEVTNRLSLAIQVRMPKNNRRSLQLPN